MKRILVLLIMFMFVSISGCSYKSNIDNNKVEKIATEDNQLITNLDTDGVENYFTVMNETIDSYIDLSNEFQSNFEHYSKDQLEDYNKRVMETINKFGEAREKVGTYNDKFTKIYGEILDSLWDLNHAANNIIDKTNGSKDKAIELYNASADRMKSIIDNRDTLKDEIIRK